jgi:methionyl-tRNA formyltransferase
LPLRLLFFADAELASSMKLLRAALDAASRRPGIEVAGIVDAAKQAPPPLWLPRALAGKTARRAFNPLTSRQIADRPPLLSTCANFARRYRVPLLEPRGLTVNDPDFTGALQMSLQPDAAMVLMVGQVFRRPLLTACGVTANYHAGSLPGYRGVGATAWSVYNEEPRSGFVYNRLSDGLDEGPILLQDSVEIPPGTTAAQVERTKTERASARIGEAMDLLATGASGHEQRGEVAMFKRADLGAIRAIGDPSRLTWAELQRRLRSFEEVELHLRGERWTVTRVRRLGGCRRQHPLAFATADGVAAEPIRFRHLPLSIYRLRRSLERRH